MQLPMTLGPPSERNAVIAGRFVLEHIAGSGGMGTVYRAHDRVEGRSVAIKVLHGENRSDALRLECEAGLLSTLSHPHIVSYVAHGVAEDGTVYLAMEWLDGEDLATRLSRSPLTVEESLTLLRRVAAALRVAHASGIVHRDIKPSNLFLVGGNVAQTKLLDFGIARNSQVRTRRVTATGMLLGTLEYMAPEQARAESNITPAVDIFSLGCTIYECLHGTSPFSGPHIASVLAKILFDTPPRISLLHPEIPSELEQILIEMLEKNPSSRLADAAALLSRLDGITFQDERRSEDRSALGSLVHPCEHAPIEAQHGIVTVLLVAPANARSLAHDQTEHSAVAARAETQVRSSLELALARFGAVPEPLFDGSMVVKIKTLPGSEVTDQVVRAAECALLVRDFRPDDDIAMATGKGLLHDSLPLGDALDRAGVMLRADSESERGQGRIFLDETTAALLDSRFVVRRLGDGFLLDSICMSADVTRPVMGRPTPCVGRDTDLAMLQGAAQASAEEPCARAVVVIAPAGAGKSRLRHEFLRRLHQVCPDHRALLGRAGHAETMSGQLLISQILRLLVVGADQKKVNFTAAAIASYVARLELPHGSEHSEFLSELCRLPLDREPSSKLVSARRDPRVLAEQWERSLVAVLRAECERGPLILVIEDLQWADSTSVRLIGTALSELYELPLLVLALARPEVAQRFPSLWSGKALELPLRPLSRRACELLITSVLGPQTDNLKVRRLVEQSAGNPLFLEELLRAVSVGKTTGLPDSILAMLQARILRLSTGLRQLVLAASALGAVFTEQEIGAAIGPSSRDDVPLLLSMACESEVLGKMIPNGPSEPEYRFIQAQLRDAAYSLIAATDRRLLHLRILQHLQRRSQVAPALIAEHALHAEEPELAISYFIQAAELALRMSNLEEAMRIGDQALALGPSGESRGRILAILVLAQVWSRKWDRVGELGAEALSLLPEGSPMWCRLAGPLGVAVLMGGQSESSMRVAERLYEIRPNQEALANYVESMALLLGALSLRCVRASADKLAARLVEVSGSVASDEALIHGWVALSRCEYVRHSAPSLREQLQLAEVGARLLTSAGDSRTQIFAQTFFGQILAECGEQDRGEQVLRASLAAAIVLQESYSVVHAQLHLAAFLAAGTSTAKNSEALRIVEQLLNGGALNPSFRSWALAISAEVHLSQGNADRSLALARESLDSAKMVPLRQLLARSVLILALLKQKQIACAQEEAVSAIGLLAHLGSAGYAAPAILLAIVETLLQSGQRTQATELLRFSLDGFAQQVCSIETPEAREGFLQKIRVHVQLLRAAETLGLSTPWARPDWSAM